MRKGRIIALNSDGRRGRIKDTNHQEIDFLLALDDPNFQVGNCVSFDIKLGVEGLFANELSMLNIDQSGIIYQDTSAGLSFEKS